MKSKTSDKTAKAKKAFKVNPKAKAKAKPKPKFFKKNSKLSSVLEELFSFLTHPKPKAKTKPKTKAIKKGQKRVQLEN